MRPFLLLLGMLIACIAIDYSLYAHGGSIVGYPFVAVSAWLILRSVYFRTILIVSVIAIPIILFLPGEDLVRPVAERGVLIVLLLALFFIKREQLLKLIQQEGQRRQVSEPKTVVQNISIREQITRVEEKATQTEDSSTEFDDSVTQAEEVHHSNRTVESDTAASDSFDSATIEYLKQEDIREFGDYSVKDLLGTGGSSYVFHATHKESNQDVALKIMSRKYRPFRFRREMKLVESLAHPNIVTAYESGHIDKRLYIAMELVEGTTLSKKVKLEGPIKSPVAFDYAYQAATALEHAHERGLIHRDVKPGNLLVTPHGLVKLSDLGLAVESEKKDDDGSFRTDDNVLGGTIEFMPPEQAFSLANAKIQSDIYALGATIYYLLTGKTYLKGSSFAQMFQNLTIKEKHQSVEIDDLPARANNLIKRMLSYEVEDRPQNCSDLRDELQTVLADLGVDSVIQIVEILIVEDDDDDVKRTIKVLEETNRSINITQVTCLNDALGELKRKNFNLILLDLNLSDSTGIHTLASMQDANEKKLPVIVLTGAPDPHIEKDCRRFGIIDFVSKETINPLQMERQMFVALSKHGEFFSRSLN